MKRTFTITTALLAAAAIASCRGGEPPSSDVASLQAAKTADASQDADGTRAPEKGGTPEEAAEKIFAFTIPDEVARFFPAKLKIEWGTKEEVTAACEGIIEKSAKKVGSHALDQNACWEFVGSDADKEIAIHMVRGSVDSVHAALPEALFAGFFEGVVSELAEAAQVSELAVKEFLETEDDQLQDTVATLQAIIDNRRKFAVTALAEMEEKNPGTLAAYASDNAFGGEADVEKLANDEDVVNFLWSELAAAYYGSPVENEAFEKELPKTFALFDKVAERMGKAWWEY